MYYGGVWSKIPYKPYKLYKPYKNNILDQIK